MLQAMKNRLPFALESGKPCRYNILLPLIFFNLLFTLPTHAQDVKENSPNIITGTVTDANGEPLLGVNILVEGTDTGTITDEVGKYSIAVSAAQTLVFSYLGFES